MSVLLLLNNANADTDEFANIHRGETATVNVDADNRSLAAQNLGGAEIVEANEKESKPIDIHPASSDVVQIDAGQGDQNSQLDLAGSQDMQSVDVDDTGTEVKFTQTADDIAGGIDDQKARVDLGDQPNESKPVNIDVTESDVVQIDADQGIQNSPLDLGGSEDLQSLNVVNTGAAVKLTHTTDDVTDSVADLDANVEPHDSPMAYLNSDSIEQQHEQLIVAGAGTNLPLTNTADAHSQLNDVSNDVTSEEKPGLPYAVVLALLALIGLVPVARRNDQHHA